MRQSVVNENTARQRKHLCLVLQPTERGRKNKTVEIALEIAESMIRPTVTAEFSRNVSALAAAKAAGVKSIAMLPQKKLLPLTGYVHGGCSPVGMKKPFPTWIDETALLTDAFFCSAGRLGAQIGIDPEALAGYIGAQFADLTEE